MGLSGASKISITFSFLFTGKGQYPRYLIFLELQFESGKERLTEAQERQVR